LPLFFFDHYFDIDVIEAPHGRAPAVAIKRANPTVCFTHQGDGDLAAIGTAEIIHVNRADISVIFVNNTTYGMTGGQMARPYFPAKRPQPLHGRPEKDVPIQ
jgi:2-oxoglutarate ferredoxin oxidoreductase subunit beta